jgi:glycosyltransferase involved in cell wall biosynthesis
MSSERAGPRVSGLVHVYNEEERLARCLESLAWCDEVLVVDAHSTDRSPEITRGFANVRLLQHEYHGAAAQKNWAIPRCRHEWVFVLDADEVCPPALADEIRRTVARADAAPAHVVRRRTWFLGRRIRYSGWQHDRVARLFRRDDALYDNRRVHARLLLRSDGRPALRTCPTMESPIDHHMVDSVAEYVERSRRYGLWGAAQCWRDGRRVSAARVVAGPALRFLRAYALYGGFLDGRAGLVFCGCQAVAVFSKWASLWGWQREAALGREPKLPSFDDDPERWLPPRGGSAATPPH